MHLSSHSCVLQASHILSCSSRAPLWNLVTILHVIPVLKINRDNGTHSDTMRCARTNTDILGTCSFAEKQVVTSVYALENLLLRSWWKRLVFQTNLNKVIRQSLKSQCLSVALAVQHAKCMRHIFLSSVSYPDLLYFFNLISQTARFSGKNLWTWNVCCDFLYNLCLKISHFKKTWARNYNKCAQVFMQIFHYSPQVLIKPEFSRYI